MKWQYVFTGLLGLLVVIGCTHSRHAYLLDLPESERVIYRIFPQPQPTGDPQKGFEYLVYGDYVGNGIPLKLYQKTFGSAQDSVLKREGDNGRVAYNVNVFESWYGEKVVNGNCFTCHAAVLEGQMVLGLGNSSLEFNRSKRLHTAILNWMVKRHYGKKSPQWAAFREHGQWLKATAAATIVDNPGVNPALRIEEATLAYRQPADLSFRAEPNFEIPRRAFGVDVPPLWTLKKKQALYYNGMGRGDFTKLLMQACLLGIHDSSAARRVQQHFPDVIAWLQQLEPPSYPIPVDTQLALRGKSIFEQQCEKCHGSYGEKPFYPNKIVHLDEVGTDPYYALYALQSPGNAWYNQSWFAQTPPKAYSKPSYGYVAPPLDGIWATAPYLHNGSVPTLEALLDSRKRPTYWQRSKQEGAYDIQAPGLPYREKASGAGKRTYNTRLPGYGNQGHTYGDTLSQAERKALIAYLKTL
ncbi:MAG: hypothetical protein D6730_08070 [Bacteroidetes bacterium]|nr:MAG: hypothetical protein D6730_08070 [Bacteroidota bacterium]